jgi:nitroreductase
MQSVTDVIKRRISTRAFLPTPLPRALVHEILEVARWSPSGGNMQPWKVIVLGGAAAQEIKTLAVAKLGNDHRSSEEGERSMYPSDLWEPYRSRRFKIAEDMYASMGITRDNKAARFAHVARNLEAFGAPVIMLFVIDKRMGYGQWAHLGMFMQTLALAAEERGVATCMQESWMRLRETLHTHFKLDANDMIYCGMAFGYADKSAPVNSLRSARAPVEEIASFRGFSN